MRAPEITVIDYGVGNLRSVQRGFERCGAKVIVTENPESVLTAERIVLPGVGAFGEGMEQLTRLGLAEAVKQAVERGAHLLGICLGMQLLLTSSEEYGYTSGLGLIPGNVVPISSRISSGKTLKIPHIGWNVLVPAVEKISWSNTLLDEMPVGSSVYFVHSFMAVPDKPSHRLADCIYGESRIPAVIGREGVWGTQFHPEKSGEIGLSILRRFIANT